MSERRIGEYMFTHISEVFSFIWEGWEPWGSPFNDPDGTGPYQSMVRYAEVHYADPEPDELARLAYELAERVQGLNPPAKYRQFREPASAILAIKAKREGGAG